ncbi:hypothetical protein SAMN05216188_1219 [Lentzea xinjiangensis]|uniref:ABC-2 family transporter protein n=1 Tax=Lentzea xinjiangensis TaxID=402600 RepID=A0A1H9UBV7_9PSEU|nr:hypothetical protein [Lentzea xinjiangensis]SES06822.1 hypothetical protein SAMN05216188_1219 [Lentzea xinjiangensis]
MTAARSLLDAARTAWLSLDERTTWQAVLLRGIGFEIAQHCRNRLALALVVFFIPSWTGLVCAIIPAEPIGFHSWVLDSVLRVDANELAMITGGINAVTLIVGFMMFASVRRSGDFDQRLVLAGYPRWCLLLAKAVALLLVSALVAVYAGVVMTVFWDPVQPWLLGFGLFVGGLTYGGLGIVLGLVLSSELAGMFVIIMISLVDAMVQNPITNPSSDLDFMRYLLAYGAMQAGAVAGFTDRGALGHALVGVAWLVLFAVIGFAAFHRRTRDHARHAPAAGEPAAVTVTRQADGSIAVRSFTGPVVLCSQLARCPAECADAPAPVTPAPVTRAPVTPAPVAPAPAARPRRPCRTATATAE